MTNQEEFLNKQRRKSSNNMEKQAPIKRNSFNFNINLNFLEINI